jgi:hypothetical protein
VDHAPALRGRIAEIIRTISLKLPVELLTQLTYPPARAARARRVTKSCIIHP